MKNKKIVVALLSGILGISAFGLTGCKTNGNKPDFDNPIEVPGGGEDKPVNPPVEPEKPAVKKFNINLKYNGNTFSSYELEENKDVFEFIKTIANPKKEGYEFGGWFINESLTEALNGALILTSDVNIYAKFSEINKSAAFTNAFNGIIKSSEHETVKDENSNELTKQYVLDRQFSVLSENLLFRLANVYGISLNNRNDGGEEYFKFNLEYDNKTYSYYGSNAIFNKANMIMDENEIENSHLHPNNAVSCVDCLSCYASYFDNTPNSNNLFERVINTSKAINGGGFWNTQTNRMDLTSLQTNSSWQWNYDEGKNLNITTEAVNYVKGYVNKYKDKLKLELAKIVSGDSTVNNYEEQLKLINHAGFTTNEKGKIETLVKNKIIGSSLVSIDDARVPENTDTYYSPLWTEDQHYYKAYSVLVPCIVSQALNQTFEYTAQSIYPFVSFETMEKENANKFTLEAGKSVYLEISDSVNIGALAINSNIATQIIVDVCNNGKVSSSKFNINILNNYVNLPGGAQTIGAFNGKLNFSDSLYNNNNPVDKQTGNIKVSEVIGKNYIKITNNKSTAVELEISGYLEKWFKEDQIIK